MHHFKSNLLLLMLLFKCNHLTFITLIQFSQHRRLYTNTNYSIQVLCMQDMASPCSSIPLASKMKMKMKVCEIKELAIIKLLLMTCCYDI